jgi:S1-C subfamily serine protease
MGSATAAQIHHACVLRYARLGYVPLPTHPLGVGYAPGTLRIAAFPEDSAAARAGLQIGDEVLQLNEEPVYSPTGTARWLATRHAGEVVQVMVRRGETVLTVPVTLP